LKRAIGDRFCEYAGVPKETVMDLAKLSFAENRELYIENHKGINMYSEDTLKIRTKNCIINIKGTDFKITYINTFDALVRGIFFSITFEHCDKRT